MVHDGSSAETASAALRRGDWGWALLVAMVSFIVFRAAPIQQSGGDSRYALLVSANLLQHRNFDLARYNLPRPDYRLRDTADGGQYYVFPVGTSILSAPYVAVMKLRGKSPVGTDGAYDFEQERRLDARLALILMAGFSALIFLTARLLLPVSWSLVVTLVISFGTQVFSTASRALWSDTWGILLVGSMIFLLLRATVEEKRSPELALGTLAGWATIVRPTNGVALLLVGGYLAVTYRSVPWRYLIAAGVWLALLVLYSWHYFHLVVPDYYRAERLEYKSIVPSLVGNLISPSRGLLVCVPAAVAVTVILSRYADTIRFRRLVALSLSVVGGHFVLLAGFGHWWGGHGFGARLTTGLVPWIALMAIVGLDAARHARARSPAIPVICGALVVLSLIINSVGAFSFRAEDWNLHPTNVDKTPERLWSWTHPQFLAPWLPPGTAAAPRDSRPTESGSGS